MSTPHIQMLPEGYFSNKDLERLLTELRKVIEVQEVMRIEDAEQFLRVSRTTINLMCKKGLPHHKIPGLEGKVFLKSEIIDYTKKH